MPFKKGDPKPPTSGRKAGYAGIRRQAIDILEELKCNPLVGMAQIAQNPKAKLELRGRMYAELAKYGWPTFRQVDHTGLAGTGTQPTIAVQFVIPHDNPTSSGVAIPVSAEAVQDSVRGPGRIEELGICDQPATNGHAATDAHPVRPRDPKLH